MSPLQAFERVREADTWVQGAGNMPLLVPITGLEAVVCGTVSALRPADWWVPGLRERAGAVLRDVGESRLKTGILEGVKPYRIAPVQTSPALRALTAVGLATVDPDVAVVVHLGIGSVADGAFAEALNLAALRRVSVVFVVAVHPLGDDAPLGPQTATTPGNLAKAYGVKSRRCDGASVKSVRDAVITGIRTGKPFVVEAMLSPGADLDARAKAEA